MHLNLNVCACAHTDTHTHSPYQLGDALELLLGYFPCLITTATVAFREAHKEVASATVIDGAK